MASTGILRDTADMLLPAVKETIAALDLPDKDTAAVRLALRYAALIDDHRDPAWALRWIGPELLRILESLGATPAARNSMKDTPAVHAGVNRLQVMRAARS